MQALRRRTAHLLGIDPRALAALRIGLGATLLADLLLRARHLAAFTTDAGVLPRGALRGLGPYVSLHALSGALAFQVLLLLLAAVAAAALLAGYRTRSATAAALVLHASLLARNPLVLHGGDSLLMLLLFWGLFLPLGSRWSMDARRGGRTSHVAGAAPAALLVQVVLIYTVNAVFKSRHDAWRNGEALLHVFSVDRFTLPPGALLAQAPALLSALTWAWLAMLWLSFLLLVLPGRPRAVAAGLFLAAHAGMLATMRLGIFPLVSMVALLPFFPAPVWDGLEGRLRRLGARLPWPTGAGAGPGPAGPAADGGPPQSVGRPPRSPVIRQPAAPPPALPRARDAAVLCSLLAVLVWAGAGLGHVPLPDALDPLVERHGRGWAMFAEPRLVEVWFAAPAWHADGTEADALHGGSVDLGRPRHVDSLDIRWRSYLDKVRPGSDLALHLAEHLCRNGWETVEVHRVEQPVDPHGPDPPGRSFLLVRHACQA